MEGPPVWIHSGDEKYLDMEKSPLHGPELFSVGAQVQCDRETDLSSAGIAVCLQQDQDKPATHISGIENTFNVNTNNCEM